MKQDSLHAALVAICSFSIVGCGSRDGHETERNHHWNLSVVNQDYRHDIEVRIDGDTVGEIKEGRMAFYRIRPGVRALALRDEHGAMQDFGPLVFTRNQQINVAYNQLYATPPPPKPEPDPDWDDDDEDDE